jgi:hypothetical protein
MSFPLTPSDLSLLLAVTSLILLVTSELLSPYRGKVNLNINKKKLRNTAFVFSILFLGTVILRVASIIIII